VVPILLLVVIPSVNQSSLFSQVPRTYWLNSDFPRGVDFSLEFFGASWQVACWILSQRWTVGDLWNMLVEYSTSRSKGETNVGFLKWLLPSVYGHGSGTNWFATYVLFGCGCCLSLNFVNVCSLSEENLAITRKKNE
jgi:hypothetical protein